MKLSWCIVSNPEALWVHLLYSKYIKGITVFSNLRAINSYSNIWRSLYSVWDLVQRGITYNIGNGKSTIFWKDFWLEGIGNLEASTLRGIPHVDRHRTVASYVTLNDQWRWDELHTFLPQYICLRLANMVPPLANNGPNSIYWNFTPLGRFSTKSA